MGKKAVSLLLTAVLVFSGQVPVVASEVDSRKSEIIWDEKESEDAAREHADEMSECEDEWEEVLAEEDDCPEDEIDMDSFSVTIDEPATVCMEDSKATSDEPGVSLAETTPDGSFAIKLQTGDSYVRSWQSSKTGKYYLFLPNNKSLNSLSFSCSGIEVKKVSSGTYDKNTKVISGAFKRSYQEIVITSVNDNEYRLVAVRSTIPSIMINLPAGVKISTITSGSKDDKYSGNTVTVIDENGAAETKSDVELKGRGNTTWKYSDKKPFQIKFSKKTSLFGMEEAKKWVLLANAFDESLMRNEIAYTTAEKLGMSNTPGLQNVNLWINGVYQGLYMIAEKVELNPGRVELSDPQGILCELDHAYYMEEDYYFTTSVSPFGVKETVSDDEENIQKGISNFKSRFEGLISYLESGDNSISNLEKYIDLESFAQYYLLTDYFVCADSFVTSAYFYQDGPDDVIHYGPVWDYDASMGNARARSKKSTVSNFDGWSRFVPMLLRHTEFNEYVREYYEQNKAVFEEAAAYSEELYNAQKDAAKMNYTRWEYALGHTSSSSGYRVKEDIEDFHATYYEGYAHLNDWLSSRYQNFRVDTSPTIVLQKNNRIEVTYKGSSDENIRCAVWSANKGSASRVWLTMKWQALPGGDGAWVATIATKEISELGRFDACIYGSNSLVSRGYTILESKVKKASLSLENKESKDTEMIITAEKAYPLNKISLAVWSETGGKDDLVWYPMKKTAYGTYSVNVNIGKHKTAGKYFASLHIDGEYAGKTSFTIGDIPTNVSVTETKDNKNGTGQVAITNISAPAGIEKVEMKVCSALYGTDKAKIYRARMTDDQSCECLFNIRDFGFRYGEYTVRVYVTAKNGIKKRVKTVRLTLAEQKPSVTVKAVANGQKIFVKNPNRQTSYLMAAIWSEKNGQDDIVWKTVRFNQDTNRGVYIWSPNAKSDKGKYLVHVYGVNAAGESTFLGSSAFTV